MLTFLKLVFGLSFLFLPALAFSDPAPENSIQAVAQETDESNLRRPCRLHAECSDGNVCNGLEICSEGFCEPGKAVYCFSENMCQPSECDPRVGCQSLSLSGTPCDDGNLCTTSDRCQEGQCVSGTPVVCPDAGECAVAMCVALRGCVTRPLAEGVSCTDQSAVSEREACESGQCDIQIRESLDKEQAEHDELFEDLPENFGY